MPSALPKNSSQDQEKLDLLKQRYTDLEQQFQSKHTEFYQWMQDNSLDLNDLRNHSDDLIQTISLAHQSVVDQPVEARVARQLAEISQNQRNEFLTQITKEEFEEILQKMTEHVNGPVGHLAEETELYLEQQLSDLLGFGVTAELDGQRLNHTIGIMGGQKHLKRHPADVLKDHHFCLQAGLDNNRGAFGWFTQEGQLTDQAIQREKYYLAVQVLYLKNWSSNYEELKQWYKFRKMIVVNPAERIAVVGVVGDIGPNMWIKKQFGGSPEIIREAKIWSPKSRGRVLVFFVDDPNDAVPLGVIQLDQVINHILQTNS